MSKTLQKATSPSKSHAAAAPVRPPRSPSLGGSGVAPSPKATILNKETIRRIGYTIAGKHWQADVAQAMGISKSQMTRWLNGSRSMPPTLNIAFEQVIYDKLVALADCLVMPGMPRSSEVYEVRRLIHDKIEPLRIKQPLDDD